MEFLILIALLGLIPAAIAKSKGYSFGLWWLYGALLFIVALPHALIMKPNREGIERRQEAEGMKKCSFCAEMIKADAKVCRYCSRDLPALTEPSQGETAVAHGKNPCPSCSKMIETNVGLCRFCGWDQSKVPDKPRFTNREEYERWKAEQGRRGPVKSAEGG